MTQELKEKNKFCKAKSKDGFFHGTNGRLFCLIYKPELAFLHSANSALNSAQSR